MMPPKMTTPPPPPSPPPTVQWWHGIGLKLSTNPGLVMTSGAFKAIFDIPSLTRGIKEKLICSFFR